MAILMRFFLPKTIEISLFSQLSKSKGFGFFYFLYLIALCSVTIRLLKDTLCKQIYIDTSCYEKKV